MALFTTHLKHYERMTDSSQACSSNQCPNLTHRVGNHGDDQTLPYLADTVNKLVSRISAMKPSCFEQLERWRSEAYQSIDHYCNKKRVDLFEKKQDNLKKELDHLQTKLNVTNEAADPLKQINHDIQLIEMKLIELEHLRLTLRPLIVEDNLITSQHLFPLSPAHHTIHLKSGKESAIGTHERHLLVERENQYLCLIDRNFVIVEDLPFSCNGIHSICWSSTINRFIIITFKEIFVLNETTMMIEKCSISFNEDWWRGTCSDDSLFVSSVEWGSSICEFDLRTEFQFIKVWHTPITCGRDEMICDLKYMSDGFLAIPIFNKHKEQSRLDLRSSTTLDCIWTVPIHGRCRCCSINGDQWIVIDHDDCRFFHIAADGRLLKTDKYEHHQRLEDVTTWNESDIVVLTKKTINLHEIR